MAEAETTEQEATDYEALYSTLVETHNQLVSQHNALTEANNKALYVANQYAPDIDINEEIQWVRTTTDDEGNVQYDYRQLASATPADDVVINKEQAPTTEPAKELPKPKGPPQFKAVAAAKAAPTRTQTPDELFASNPEAYAKGVSDMMMAEANKTIPIVVAPSTLA